MEGGKWATILPFPVPTLLAWLLAETNPKISTNLAKILALCNESTMMNIGPEWNSDGSNWRQGRFVRRSKIMRCYQMCSTDSCVITNAHQKVLPPTRDLVNGILDHQEQVTYTISKLIKECRTNTHYCVDLLALPSCYRNQHILN
jgi:transcription termination factor NusB